MLPETDNRKHLGNLTLLRELEFWWRERETYPSRLEIEGTGRLRAGTNIHITVQPEKNWIPIDDEGCLLSSHHLIHERLTESTADRLVAALKPIRMQQLIEFDDCLRYMILLYLMFYDLERAQAGKISLLMLNQSPQKDENGQEAIQPLWSLEDILRFWDTFDGRLNEGFLPPEGHGRGEWSYHTIPPVWLSEVPAAERSASVEDGSALLCPPPSSHKVPVMVPAPLLETLVENFVALFQILKQHGVQLPISIGTAVAESQAEYVGGKDIFRQKGEVWDIVYQGHSFSLKHIKGLHYIAFLLRHPTKKFTPRQLSEGIGDSVPAKGDRVYSSMSKTRLEDVGLRSSAWDAETIDAEKMVDKQTIDQCQQQWADLKEQKEEAELCHNYERAAQLQDDMDAIADYLTNTTFRGKSKKFQTDSDKIRTSVTKRIHDAINKIRQQDDTLARQLHNCIRTGNQCFYDPDPQNLISWSF